MTVELETIGTLRIIKLDLFGGRNWPGQEDCWFDWFVGDFFTGAKMLSVDYGRDHKKSPRVGFVGYPDRVLIIFGTELSKTGQKEKWKKIWSLIDYFAERWQFDAWLMALFRGWNPNRRTWWENMKWIMDILIHGCFHITGWKFPQCRSNQLRSPSKWKPVFQWHPVTEPDSNLLTTIYQNTLVSSVATSICS